MLMFEKSSLTKPRAQTWLNHGLPSSRNPRFRFSAEVKPQWPSNAFHVGPLACNQCRQALLTEPSPRLLLLFSILLYWKLNPKHAKSQIGPSVKVFVCGFFSSFLFLKCGLATVSRLASSTLAHVVIIPWYIHMLTVSISIVRLVSLG